MSLCDTLTHVTREAGKWTTCLSDGGLLPLQLSPEKVKVQPQGVSVRQAGPSERHAPLPESECGPQEGDSREEEPSDFSAGQETNGHCSGSQSHRAVPTGH